MSWNEAVDPQMVRVVEIFEAEGPPIRRLRPSAARVNEPRAWKLSMPEWLMRIWPSGPMTRLKRPPCSRSVKKTPR